MKFLLISGNPKSGGLCRALETAIENGARDGGAEVTRVTTGGVERCRVCGDGWGTCRDTHKCAFGAGAFDELQTLAREADRIAIVTPVYWAEASEGLLAFLDKLRRCEAFGGDGLRGKPVLLAASPGGSGNGLVSALDQLERFCKHTGANVFDFIGQNRWNAAYKQKAAYEAAKLLVTAPDNFGAR
ncbi:MAG: flavodoxin family protein [Oscillospiraceae bacterium]|jgi:multimeric flavodoxin WrbA|nr:flavodoxin family protein [Oscillospiraceae bacterium]